MASPNLAVTHIAASQNQKEVTINDAVDALDKAGNDVVDIDCSAGNTNVAAADYRRHFLLRLTGSPAAAFTLTLPDGKRVTAIHNTTSRSATLRTTTLGTTLALPAGKLLIVGSRGSELLALAASAIGGLYDMGLFVPGQPAATALVFQSAFPRAVTFPANLTGSTAQAATAASSAASFTLRRNGTNVGSVAFAAGSATGSFSLAGGVSFASGDLLELLAPSPQDATLADISFCLVGTRN